MQNSTFVHKKYMPGNDDFVWMVSFDLFDSAAPVGRSFLRDELDVQESALARAITVTRRGPTNNSEKVIINGFSPFRKVQ